MEATEIQQHEIAEIEEFAAKRDTMLGEIRKVIVGQDRVIEEVLIALFARGHCLLVGVPGSGEDAVDQHPRRRFWIWTSTAFSSRRT